MTRFNARPISPADTPSPIALSRSDKVAPEPLDDPVPAGTHHEPSDRVEARVPGDLAPGQIELLLQVGKHRAEPVEHEAQQTEAGVGEKRCPISPQGHVRRKVVGESVITVAR